MAPGSASEDFLGEDDPIVVGTKIIAEDDESQEAKFYLIQKHGQRLSSAEWQSSEDNEPFQIEKLRSRWERDKESARLAGRSEPFDRELWENAREAAMESRNAKEKTENARTTNEEASRLPTAGTPSISVSVSSGPFEEKTNALPPETSSEHLTNRPEAFEYEDESHTSVGSPMRIDSDDIAVSRPQRLVRPQVDKTGSESPVKFSSPDSNWSEQSLASEPRGAKRSLPLDEGAASIALKRKYSVPEAAESTGRASTTLRSNSTPNVILERSSVFASNGPKNQMTRRERPRVSGDTPKQSAEPRFARLSTQNRYQRYGQNEPAPNPDMLSMVDPKTGKVQQALVQSPAQSPSEQTDSSRSPLFVGPKDDRPGAAPARGSDENRKPQPKRNSVLSRRDSGEIASAYGRRSPPRQVRRSPSPGSDAPVQRPSARRPSAPSSEDLLQMLKLKTCRDWQAGSCRHGSNCHYAHEEAPGKSMTCWFFTTPGGCRQSERQCKYAHHHTGIIAPPPPGFVDRKSAKPVVPQIQTAALEPAPKDRGFQTATPILSEAVLKAVVSNEPQQHYGQIPPNLVQRERDPRLRRTSSALDSLGELTMGSAEQRDKEPIVKYPRLNRGLDENDNYDEDLRALDRYLKAGGKVDKLLLINGRSTPIDQVVLKFPPERKAEALLLRKWFGDQSCRVYNELQTKSNFVKDSLLVVHEEEVFRGNLPRLSKVLDSPIDLNVISMGAYDDGSCNRVYKEKAIFQGGRVTFLSDDVFYYYPELATEIIRKFMAGVSGNTKDKSQPRHRIGTRPGIEEWLRELAYPGSDVKNGKQLSSDQIPHWEEAYEAICQLCPAREMVEDTLSGALYPSETSHLWSPPPSRFPSFQGLWDKDQHKSTDQLLDFFALHASENVHRYRRFYFIYARPDDTISASKKSERADAWAERYDIITYVRPHDMVKGSDRATQTLA